MVCKSLESTQHNQLREIDPFINCLVLQFKTVLSPGKELSIDEDIRAFKRKVDFHSYNPKKCKK